MSKLTSQESLRQSEPAPKHRLAGGLVLPVALAVACVLSLVVGATNIADGDVGALLQARGDRTVVGILVGAAVAVSGTALQGLTRNPLADPGILGINAGAALAVVIGITAFSINSLLGYMTFALIGAIAAAVAVLLLASAATRAVGSNSAPVSMALAGMVLTAATTSIAAALLIAHGKSLDVYRYWQVGSVAGRAVSDLWPVVPFFVVGFAVAFFAGGRLDILAMGDEMATGLGEKPGKLRLIIGGAAVLLAAAAVATAGPIGFVGLVAPHLLRPIVGTSYKVLLGASAFVGATIVVLADTLGRVVSPPSEVQVGIMTAVLGCPALLWVVSRMRSL